MFRSLGEGWRAKRLRLAWKKRHGDSKRVAEWLKDNPPSQAWINNGWDGLDWAFLEMPMASGWDR